MNKLIVVFLTIYLFSCNQDSKYDIGEYFTLVNKAELDICSNNFEPALSTYKLAFRKIQKPFGKDLFNAALCSQLSKNVSDRNKYLQTIINNSNELDYVSSKFVGTYLTSDEWKKLVSNQKIAYAPDLRKEFIEIRERDQLLRPMYDTHDDTINSNRIINLKRIIELTDSQGFPSHIELGFSNYLRSQEHHIVLHHTAQRRSQDKSVMDLEPLLSSAVRAGRLDPETAIFYMNFQNDLEKGKFEVYSTWQYKHELLPDSLNNKIWLPKLTKEQKIEINNQRKQWYANSIENIAQKTEYLANSNLPFIFTCMRKSVANLRDNFDREEALEQYRIPTSRMEEYE